jgi:hypothetical protein
MRLIWSMPSKRRWRNSLAAGLAALSLMQAAAAQDQPVAKLGDQTLEIYGAEGSGTLPAFSSRPLLARMPKITRLLVMVHGAARNADQALALGRAVLGAEAEQTLVVAPQFLTTADVKRWVLPANRLRWSGTAWADGLPATGRAPVSPFSALDSILRNLADPGLLPDLKTIAIAGEGKGADLVQLYAAVTTHLEGLEKRGIALRFVLAEPEHYLYLDQARPVPVDAAACPGFNRWPYGLDGAPAYLDEIGPARIFTQYRARDVTYLLGEAGQAEPADCAAAAQGPDSTARGRFYASYLAKLAAGTKLHRLAEIPKPDAAHGLLASACGAAAMLGRSECPALTAAPDLPAFPDPTAKPEPAEAPKADVAKTEPPKAPDAVPPAQAPPTDGAPAAAPPAPAPAIAPLPPPDQVAPDGLADPLHEANPLGPLLTKPPPPKPKQAPPQPPS